MTRTTFHQITVAPGVWPSAHLLDRLRPLAGQQPLVLGDWPAPGSAMLRSIGRTDALLAGWKDRLDAGRLAQMPRLRYIGLRATSTDRVDLRYTAEHGITVAPIHGYGDVGTVEFVVEQLLRHARHGGATRGELAGKRLGIVGYGNVGAAVGRVAMALGMQVVFHTPTARPGPPDGPQWECLPDLLATADYVSFHSPAYRHVVGLDELRLIASDALVVMTTLGLPTADGDFQTWQMSRTGPVVLDLCAADALPDAIAGLPGVHIHDLYAARTAESVRRAETQLLANLVANLAAPDPQTQ
ncbi:glycerate dehydrogenase [Micromonospora viridifaciens]|uniref:Glycerate dehydrogenase n=1 Tax=Micromonospora viridifaciens TaxID=1881 RepID=A0A1C4X1D9_MICVI|nr:NAD(P)-dependent oxidoreductase [Micromonospora viridifaciens]SCF02256.1 glycerate dehydrogenase [Micromonospora viridifaciens]